MASCTKERHVWTRVESKMNTPIERELHCDCGAVAFGALSQGADYTTVYTKDGTAVFSRDHRKE